MKISIPLVIGVALILAQSAKSDETGDPCPAQIVSRICPVTGFIEGSEGEESNTRRQNCENYDSSLKVYRSTLVEAYKIAPAYLKKILCGLERIYIERGQEFTDDAWSSRRDDLNFVGFRATVFRKGVDFKTNFSSHDQQFFKGGKKDEIQKDLPYILPDESSGIDTVAGALVGQLGREAGHLIWSQYPDLAALWKEFGWEDISHDGTLISTLRNQDLRIFRSKLCLSARCTYEELAPRGFASEAYHTISSSEFPTLASVSSPEEDFCESMSLFTLSKIASHMRFFIPSTGETIDLLEKFKKPTPDSQPRSEFLERVEELIVLQPTDTKNQ